MKPVITGVPVDQWKRLLLPITHLIFNGSFPSLINEPKGQKISCKILLPLKLGYYGNSKQLFMFSCFMINHIYIAYINLMEAKVYTKTSTVMKIWLAWQKKKCRFSFVWSPNELNPIYAFSKGHYIYTVNFVCYCYGNQISMIISLTDAFAFSESLFHL